MPSRKSKASGSEDEDMGQAQSGKRGSASQPVSGASTPATSNRRRQTKSGANTPNLQRSADSKQRRRSNAASTSPAPVAAASAGSSSPKAFAVTAASAAAAASTSSATSAAKPASNSDVEFSAPLAAADEQIFDNKTLSSEDDFPGPPTLLPGILDAKIASIQIETDDADDDDEDDDDDADSEGANQETLEAAKQLMQRAQAALQEAKKRDEDQQLKLALTTEDDQRFLDDGPAFNDSSLREVLCYLKDKGGGVDEPLQAAAAAADADASSPRKISSTEKPGVESDSDSDECPDLVDEEDGPILPAEIVTNDNVAAKNNNNNNRRNNQSGGGSEHTKNEDDDDDIGIRNASSDDEPPPMTTDLLMKKQPSTKMLIAAQHHQHEVDIFNPVQDPVKRELMMRAKDSLSAISDAVFNSPVKSSPKLRDNAIPIVSDVKIVDPEIRNMAAAAAFEQLDIDANLTEEERIRKALDEYALMMGAADKLIAESRQKAADADQQRDFMRLKADAKIEEQKKKAETLEAKKREIEMLMEANELEMKARRMKEEAAKMKEEAERKKEAERRRMEEAAMRELEDIQEEKEEEEEEEKAMVEVKVGQAKEDVVVVEIEVVDQAPPTSREESKEEEDKVIEVVAAAVAPVVAVEAEAVSSAAALMEALPPAKEEPRPESAPTMEAPDLSALLSSLDQLAAKGSEMAMEQSKTMSILKPLVGDMLLNIEEKEAQLEDMRNEAEELDDEEIPRLDQQNERLFNGMKEMYNNKFLFDYILVVEGKGVPCHKCALYASSPYFRQYFQICDKPKDEHSMKLDDLHHESVQRLVDYMYTNQLTVNLVRAKPLFDAASFFEMESVVRAVEDCIKESLSPKNAIDFYRFFADRENEKMKQLTTEFILDRFPLISLREEFLQLTYEELLHFVSSDKLNAEFEEFVFEAVMHWVTHDVDARVEHLLPLLQQIRFLFLNSDYITESVASHDLIREKLPCRALVSSAKIAKLTFSSASAAAAAAAAEGDDPSSSLHLGFSTMPRLGMFSESALLFVGGGDSPQHRSLHAYHPESKTSYYLDKPGDDRTSFKHTLRHHGVVATGVNRIFCIGGVLFETAPLEESGAEKYVSLDATMTLDFQTKGWTECASMPTTRCFFASAAIGDKIYVFGGRASYQAGTTLNTALVYDTEKDAWNSIAPLPRPSYNARAVSYEDSVYLLGGVDEYGHAMDAAYRYDPASNTYETLPSMMESRASFGAAFINDDNLLVMGGYKPDHRGANIQDSEMYKRRKRVWTKMPEFPEDRRNMIVFYHDGTLYAGGGSKVIASRTKMGAKTVHPNDLFRFDRDQMAWVRDNKYVKSMNSDGWCLGRVNTKRLVKV